MKKFVLFAALLVCVVSCSSTSDSVMNGKSIVSKWQLVKVSGGITGQTVVPKLTSEIAISKTEIKIYEGGTLIATEKYTIETKKSIFGGEKHMLVYTSGSPSQGYVLEGNKLLLNDECYDCYQKEYTKK
ncbi:hypothetical protein [Flavobacterium frigidarium]|uniref:hypothetical protein n=1 Tax=Flavobacterium frigidarium TaxID=99286 RepID=UPI0030D91700|tara:strand:+ start:3510 stop:3896 length:387 start_codon:yes stop_codon:yes gene_type:complete